MLICDSGKWGIAGIGGSPKCKTLMATVDNINDTGNDNQNNDHHHHHHHHHHHDFGEVSSYVSLFLVLTALNSSTTSWGRRVKIIITPSWCTCKCHYMGVSKNRGTPKWMVYNGKPLLRWMIWGYHYFRKHSYHQPNALFFGQSGKSLKIYHTFGFF